MVDQVVPRAEAAPGQGESLAERNNRNLSDLLQELRVAGLGVQMLFGFLLSLPFTVRFARLDQAQLDLYRASLLCAALATSMLIAPVAYHRWVFRRHEKSRLLRSANVMALIGLTSVALAVTSAVWLILSVVGDGGIVGVAAGLVTATIAFTWFALPIGERLMGSQDVSTQPRRAAEGR